MVKIFKRLLFTIKTSFRSSPVMFITLLVAGILYGLSFSFIALKSQAFFDLLANDHQATQMQIFYSLGLFILLLFINYFLNGFVNKLLDILAEKTSNLARAEFARYIDDLNPIHYEDHHFIDKLESGKDCLDMFGYIAIIVLTIVTSSIPSILCLSYTYYRNSRLLFVVPIILLLVNTILAKNKFEVGERAKHELSAIGKELSADTEMLTAREFFTEVRHLNLFNFLYNKTFLHRSKYIEVRKRISAEQFKTDGVNCLVNFLSVLVIFILSLVLYSKQLITVGALGALLITANSLSTLINELFFNELNIVIDMYPNICDYFEFKENFKQDERRPLPLTTPPQIEFRNVSFSYGDHAVLHNLTFTVQAGEKVALVGENGSGKTTLTKLILGEYLPEEGDIWINGKNTRDYRPSNERAYIQQEPLIYPLSLQQNIALNRERSSDFGDCEYYLNIGELNPEDVLTKQFGVTDLSKGQAQRLSIARGLWQHSYLLITDEPTSALDPDSEHTVIASIFQNAVNKTLIAVTHRLSMCRKCDRILVLEKGRIIENGSFDELMQAGGNFSTLYNEQVKWF